LEELHLHRQDLKGPVEVVDDSLQQRTKGGGSMAIDESREEFLGLRIKNGIFTGIGARHRNEFLSGIRIPIPFPSAIIFSIPYATEKSTGNQPFNPPGDGKPIQEARNS
jgi:hypothetical protein